jgi:hypothetical protein
MDIHKPKPFHGVREFLKEYGIIVLGVLTALALEQSVEWLHWRHKAHFAKEAMRTELLFDDGPQVYQRAAMHPCVVARLDDIRTAVEQRKPREVVASLIQGYWVQFLTFDSLAHDAAIASGVADHIPAEELQAFTLAYTSMPMMDRISAQEAADLARLRAINKAGGPLSEAESGQVLQAVEALRNDDRIMWVSAKWTIPQLKKLGGKLDPERMRYFMTNARGFYGACIKDLPGDWPASLPRDA